MATKKDLIEAQAFSRRRLLTAFASGAPGGKELEPAKPLRAVAAGIALTAIVVIGGLFYGLIRPGLPNGWEKSSLILVSDTGARYLAIDGTLYPVINTTSAQLLMPADNSKTFTTDRSSLGRIKVGPAIGILGAPDALPAPESLIPTGWSACPVTDGTAVTVSATPAIQQKPGGSVVSHDGALFIVTNGYRYEVDATAADSVLRAVGLGAAKPMTVTGGWLNLFDPGEKLAPVQVPNAGSALHTTDLKVGTVVHPLGSPASERYLMTPDGELAPLSPLAYQLYLLGSGSTLGAERDVTPSALAQLPTATQPAGGIDWPNDSIANLDGTPCALLNHDDNGQPHTSLGVAVASEDPPAGVTVDIGAGALVRAGGQGEQSAGIVVLIDESGTAFAIPGADDDIIARLGYTADDLSKIPDRWLQFMPTGPTLTTEAAGSTPNADGGN